jgi:hypothetical protein
MIDCDWVLVNKRLPRQSVTLPEPNLPQTGDGKSHNNVGYMVVLVVANRTNQQNPLIVAIEVL